jgi:hypothetical protein
MSLHNFAYALPVLHYILLSQNCLCSPSELSTFFVARQPRFRLPNLHPPALGVDINRLQRAHLICEHLRIFAYTLPEVGYIHHSKTNWLLSMQQHTNSVFSFAQPPWPLWLTKLASAAWESPVGVSSPAPGDRGRTVIRQAGAER